MKRLGSMTITSMTIFFLNIITTLQVLGSTRTAPYCDEVDSWNPKIAFDNCIERSMTEKAFLFINNYLMPILLLLSMVTFIWGLIQYFNKETQGKGKKKILYGLASFTLVILIWYFLSLFFQM